MLPSAKNDLVDIADRLSSFYKNTALRVYDKLTDAIRKLKKFPYMGAEYQSSVSDFAYRKLVVGDYLVFYVVLENAVEIHSIINGKMDIRSLI